MAVKINPTIAAESWCLVGVRNAAKRVSAKQMMAISAAVRCRVIAARRRWRNGSGGVKVTVECASLVLRLNSCEKLVASRT